MIVFIFKLKYIILIIFYYRVTAGKRHTNFNKSLHCHHLLLLMV